VPKVENRKRNHENTKNGKHEEEPKVRKPQKPVSRGVAENAERILIGNHFERGLPSLLYWLFLLRALGVSVVS
jgi:hypothetical protein